MALIDIRPKSRRRRSRRASWLSWTAGPRCNGWPCDGRAVVIAPGASEASRSRRELPPHERGIEPEPRELTKNEADVLLGEILRPVAGDRDLDAVSTVLLVPGLLAGLEDEAVGHEPPLERSTINLGAHVGLASILSAFSGGSGESRRRRRSVDAWPRGSAPHQREAR